MGGPIGFVMDLATNPQRTFAVCGALVIMEVLLNVAVILKVNCTL